MTYKYDVALSFAGEDREFVEKIADALKKKDIRVFYDKFYGPEMWGEDLSIMLRNVYWKDSRYCMMILSDSYIEKEWPKLERKNAIERFIGQEDAYILPVRLDGFSGNVPGLPNTIAYFQAESSDPEAVVCYLLTKFQKRNRSQLRLPKYLDRYTGEFPVSFSGYEKVWISDRADGRTKTLVVNPAEAGRKYDQWTKDILEASGTSKRKREHEKEKTSSDDTEINRQDSYFPTELVDQKIEEEVATLRKSRFFMEFDGTDFSLKLAKKIAEGEFSGGTNFVRSRALAWCVRVFSLEKELSRETEKYLAVAKELGTCEETEIAEALVRSQGKDKEKALDVLAEINSPAARSAAFIVVARHDGSREALNWLTVTGISPEDLDFDGKYHFLAHRFELSDWNEVRKCVDILTVEDMTEVPLLHYLTAMTHLLMAVPDEFRVAVRWRPPFEEVEFALASDEDAVSECRKARDHFLKAHEAARELDCPEAANAFEEYALWLEASDPDDSDEGKRRLTERLCDLESSLHLVRLGIHYETGLDPGAVENEIERQTTLLGEIKRDVAYARFALLFTKDDPEDIGNYLELHQDDISRYFDKNYVQALKIKMFCEAGLLDKASKCLAVISKEEVTEAFYEEVRKTVDEAQPSDPVEAQKKLFKETGSLKDLMLLVNELRDRNMWEELCEYARTLFEKTRSLHDAEGLANVFCKTRRTDLLVEFVGANPDLKKRSKYLQMVYCWALYGEGSLLEARSEFRELDCGYDDRYYRDYRALQVNLAVSIGDWNELSTFVATELSEKDNRSGLELISVALLAWDLGLSSAKELTAMAAQKGDDPNVLGAAYSLALKADWKEDSGIHPRSWLEKSLSLSGDDGPIRTVSFKEIMERGPNWRNRVDETWRQLKRVEVPMFAAARSLNRPLLDLTLVPALSNPSEKDIRRRTAIPAYSGSRRTSPVDTEGTVGIDATALITLGFLNLLDKAFDAFETVYVPHSTLAWLFDEKRKASPHQPSRIADARKLRNLFSSDTLEELDPNAVPDGELSVLIGEDLATLIAEAEKTADGDVQRIVVRPSPVYEDASMMEKEADLTAHARVISGCGPIVGKLLQMGKITAETESKMSAYLDLHEKPWPNQPEIMDGATLYLDYVSVAYLLHLGALEKLREAGFRPVVSRAAVSETNELLSYEEISRDVDEVVERIRSALSSRIKSGKVKLARRLDTGDPVNQSLYEQTAGVLALANSCDAIIADDRFFNQHTVVYNSGERASVFSTLDLLDSLASSNSITSQQRLEYRTRLRNAGYFFIPVDEEEAKHLLGTSSVRDGKVVERVELVAIRENILCVQMKDWLQLPKEWGWVYLSLSALFQAARGVWTVEGDLAAARARSDWVIDKVNMEGWIQSLYHNNKDSIAHNTFGLQILTMIPPPSDVPRSVGEGYWKWLEDRILLPVKNEHPDLYSWIVEFYKKEISKLAEKYLNEEAKETESPYDKTALGVEIALGVPSLLRDSLLGDPVFCEEYGLLADPDILFEYYSVSVRRSELFRAVREILSGTREQEVTDGEGRKWKLKNTGGENWLPRFELSRPGEKFPLALDFVALSPKTEIRLRFLEKIALELNLPKDSENYWHDILAKRPLDGNEVQELSEDFLHTPGGIMRFIGSGIAGWQVSSLVPASRKYFDRLVGEYDGSADAKVYAAGKGRELFRQLSYWNPYEGFLLSLLLSSHSALTDEITVDRLSAEELARAYGFLEQHGDRISQMGAIEIGFRVLMSNPEIEPVLVRIVRQVLDDDIDGTTSGFKLLSALFLLVDGQMSRIRLLSSEPPFYRRLAALSHAALIHRQLMNSEVDSDSFYEWAFAARGGEHNLQSLVDMMREPHWSPGFGTAGHIKLNFYERISRAAKKHERNIKNSELAKLVSETEPKGTRYFYPPCPLDGTTERGQCLPIDILDSLEAQVSAGKVSPSSFVVLVDSVRRFRIGLEQAELVARALRSCGYQLTNTKDKAEFLMMLRSLASVASVTRSRGLADELIKVMRVHRNKVRLGVSMEEEMVICLEAAASRENMDDWAEFVGNWVTELAFGDWGNGGRKWEFHMQLRYLCLIVPELWTSCDRAYAALTAQQNHIQVGSAFSVKA